LKVRVGAAGTTLGRPERAGNGGFLRQRRTAAIGVGAPAEAMTPRPAKASATFDGS
jgi:hypothetical protein